MQRFVSRLVLTLVLLAATVAGAQAGPATDTLSQSVDKIIALLADPAYKASDTRPAMRAGWKAEFVLEILTPEYIDPTLLQDVTNTAGRLVGVGDFRPTYGRFLIDRFEVLGK